MDNITSCYWCFENQDPRTINIDKDYRPDSPAHGCCDYHKAINESMPPVYIRFENEEPNSTPKVSH